ncbi:DUF4365 domain-containing protein [Streptomyces sp. BK340]|uniref:DUF4365 domain-containing protein n=1 Tax=Streptomyces sp. BK340 TaxID=2572903 RepID=UPI0011AB97BE|nr:DUF4365 domain-containing protein [Streptomyces sp. BK340]TVZ75376.1 uncharacterized protein DUF4429 [Streptomyces sp. BK340]
MATISASRKIERAGVNALRTLLEEHDHLVQEIDGGADHGEDLYVAFASEGRRTGHVIAIQVKSGKKYKRANGYAIPVAGHRDDWKESRLPVVGVVYDRDEKRLFWVNLTEELRRGSEATWIQVPRVNELTDESLHGFIAALQAFIDTQGMWLGSEDESEGQSPDTGGTYSKEFLNLTIPPNLSEDAQTTAHKSATTTAGGRTAPRAPGPERKHTSAGIAEPDRADRYSDVRLAVVALKADRHRARERGYQDGVRLAPHLSWLALDELANRDFDFGSWLEGWCNGWLDIQTGQAASGAAGPTWLPLLADHLGALVDPIGYDRWSFTPSREYLDGFVTGLRTVWQDAGATMPGRISPEPQSAPISGAGIARSQEEQRTSSADTASARGQGPSCAVPAEAVTPPVVCSDQKRLTTVKGVLGSINFDGETVTIRKEGYGPRMKGIRSLAVREIDHVIVRPATAMFHGYIQFVVRDHPPAPDRRLSMASGRPHREDPDSMSYTRRANREIEHLKTEIESAIATARDGAPPSGAAVTA